MTRTPLTTATIAKIALTASFLAGAASAQTADPAAILEQYCVTCHNETLRTAGLSLDPAGLSDPEADAEVWEKVIRKLRSGAMPPVSAPRPAPEEYDRAASFLEAELDRAAARSPNPGPLPLLRRLTRTEYRNAIRDLLALEALPQEMDYDLLLPADNASSGFDNIADLLFISPATMERYLEAARKISRLALGDPTSPAMVNIYRLPAEHSQNERVEGLPFGTRGGLAIESHFPLDGEYIVDVDLAGRSREPDQLELTVDGARIRVVTLGGRGGGPSTEFQIPLTSGPHVIGVTFVERNEVFDETILLPKMRSRGSGAAIGSVTVRGPFNAAGPGASPSREAVFTCQPREGSEAVECARRILSDLVRRAYRRPATGDDLEDLMPFYAAGAAERGFEFGIQKALERLLVSPQFLFRIEREPAGLAPGTTYGVTDLELASRLSFFLWSSIPDEALLDAALAGDLRDPEGLEAQVRRMLDDPRADSLVTNFATQWLFLGDVDLKEPDPLLFRHFDETLRHAFRRETELFLESVFGENRSVLELLDSDYTFLNERLADHYGIPNVRGSEFRRVALPEGSLRGGLLGQASVLMLTSYSTRTSPVLRGKYVLDNLLASPPPPPPPDVPALTTESRESGETLSMRDAMIQHRANPACASCHAAMDPIGFALENFDALGRWRETDAGLPVDASGAFPGGATFEGLEGLKTLLMNDPVPFVSAMTERLLMYAVGRNVQYYDAPAVRRIVARAAADDYRFDSLVLGIVQSTPFRMRIANGGD